MSSVAGTGGGDVFENAGMHENVEYERKPAALGEVYGAGVYLWLLAEWGKCCAQIELSEDSLASPGTHSRGGISEGPSVDRCQIGECTHHGVLISNLIPLGLE
ncbi:MAG: hypothetical protein ACI9F9_000106 [Candidatus Paceibacteria bacterium]|jgi:hypothetical protein